MWTSRPAAAASLAGLHETLNLSAYDVPTAKMFLAEWNAGSSPTVVFGAGAQNLSTAGAVKAVATLRWTPSRSKKQATRTLATIISRGGISKSELP